MSYESSERPRSALRDLIREPGRKLHNISAKQVISRLPLCQ